MTWRHFEEHGGNTAAARGAPRHDQRIVGWGLRRL